MGLIPLRGLPYARILEILHTIVVKTMLRFHLYISANPAEQATPTRGEERRKSDRSLSSSSGKPATSLHKQGESGLGWRTPSACCSKQQKDRHRVPTGKHPSQVHAAIRNAEVRCRYPLTSFSPNAAEFCGSFITGVITCLMSLSELGWVASLDGFPTVEYGPPWGL